MTSEDILADAKLLFFFAKVSGFISFSIKRAKNGEKCIVFEKFHYWLFLTLQTLIQIRVLFLFNDFCTWNTFSDNNFLYILRMISELSHNTFCMVICIWNKIYATENQKLWQMLYKVEKDLQRLQIELNHTVLRKVANSCVYCALGISIFLSGCYILFDEKKSEIDTVYYITLRFCNYYKVVTVMYVYCQQIVFFSIIKGIFEELEKAVNQNVLGSRYSSCKYLLEVAKCHQKVSEIAKQGNNIIAIPLVFEFVHLFCFLTASYFSSAVAVIKNVHILRDIMRLTWITIILTVVILIVVVSHNCMKKVSS